MGFCHKCGAKLDLGDEFCGACGAKVKPADVEPAEAGDPTPAVAAPVVPPPVDVRLSGTVESRHRAASRVVLLKGTGALATCAGALLVAMPAEIVDPGTSAMGLLLFLGGIAVFVAGRVME